MNIMLQNDKTNCNLFRVAHHSPILKLLQAASFFDPIPKQKITINFLDRLSYLKKNILNFLVHLTAKYKKVCPSQATIAKFAGISRGHCNKVLQEMVQEGLINKLYRHMTSCLYRVSSLFLKPEMKSTVGYFLLAVKALSLDNITQLNLGYKEYDYKLNHTTKKIGIMTEKLNPIPQEIRNLTDLSLSKWGQIKLCAFPIEAITYAAAKLPYFKNLASPFNCFFKLCLDFCADNDLQPDWQWVKDLENTYKPPTNAAMTVKSPLPAPQPQKREVETQVTKTPYQRSGYMGITPTLIYKAPEEPKLTPRQVQQETTTIQESINNPQAQRFLELFGSKYMEKVLFNTSRRVNDQS